MAFRSKSSAYFIIVLACLVTVASFTQQATSNYSSGVQKAASVQSISLEANKLGTFNVYNTNGTPPYIDGSSALFFGSSATAVYSDIVSLSSIRAEKSLVLEARATVNVSSFSNTGEDQLAIFAADDTIKYKGDEFGFVLPETGNTWYAYIQTPKAPSWFVWKPVLTLDASGLTQHSFKAIYSSLGSFSFVDYYVDSKLVWTTFYPNISGQSFHMVLTSHKVSDENIDLSRNAMAVGNASLTDSSASAQNLSYFSGL
jgi:hypothetical protein